MGSNPLCRGADSVFYTPSRLGILNFCLFFISVFNIHTSFFLSFFVSFIITHSFFLTIFLSIYFFSPILFNLFLFLAFICHCVEFWKIIKGWLLYIDLWPGQTCYSKDGRSCIFHWRGQAWLTVWDRVKIPRYCHKLMHRKRVTRELYDSYFRSMMIKTCHSKDGGSGIIRCPFMGSGWLGVELLYNSVHRKFKEKKKDTLLCPEELGRSVCCSSVRSLTPSHTQPFQ